jgi:hypothetical protein
MKDTIKANNIFKQYEEKIENNDLDSFNAIFLESKLN